MDIYLDVDDTLADFKGYAIERGIPPWSGTWYTQHPDTWTQEQKDIQAQTVKLMEQPDFWPNIPVKEGAVDLIKEAWNLSEKVFLLTAWPRNVDEAMLPMIIRQKHTYGTARLKFSPGGVIVCAREQKVQYAVRHTWDGKKPNVLVDDAIQNCYEWQQAGGIAIHYQNAEQAIRELRLL